MWVLLVGAAFAIAPFVQAPPIKEKVARTAALGKIDPQLLYALYRQRGDAETKGVPEGDLRVKFDDKRRAFVTIRARVTKDLLSTIRKTGGEVVSSSVEYSDIRAYMPLEKLESLAGSKDVRAIMPADESTAGRIK